MPAMAAILDVLVHEFWLSISFSYLCGCESNLRIQIFDEMNSWQVYLTNLSCTKFETFAHFCRNRVKVVYSCTANTVSLSHLYAKTTRARYKMKYLPHLSYSQVYSLVIWRLNSNGKFDKSEGKHIEFWNEFGGATQRRVRELRVSHLKLGSKRETRLIRASVLYLVTSFSKT